MDVKKRQSESKEQNQQEIGGREFGQVIEPTQGQMASGNKGLTEDFGRQKPAAKKPMKKGRRAA